MYTYISICIYIHIDIYIYIYTNIYTPSNMLQHAATHCNSLHHTATSCTCGAVLGDKDKCTGCTPSNTLQRTTTQCNTLPLAVLLRSSSERRRQKQWQHAQQNTTTRCNTVRHTATRCNTLQHTATRCNTLQHAATYYSTLHLWCSAEWRRQLHWQHARQVLDIFHEHNNLEILLWRYCTWNWRESVLCMHADIYIHIYVYMYDHKILLRLLLSVRLVGAHLLYTCKNTRIYTWKFINIHTYTYEYATPLDSAATRLRVKLAKDRPLWYKTLHFCLYIYTYVYMYIYMHVYIYLHIHI